ncbi:MAG: Hsp20/alpha crystallin family protein [Spirochaetia bacterium]|nr:Hsp20/alpha crystallin family protein [Spirochaetia bacterium]
MLLNLIDRKLNENGLWSDFNRLHNELSRGFYSQDSYSNGFNPPLNFYVNEDGAMVYCLVPGFNQDDIDISINDKQLQLAGKKEKETLDEKSRVVMEEIKMDQFSRNIELPFRVDADKVVAQYRDGILKISLPKAESEKPKKIKVS